MSYCENCAVKVKGDWDTCPLCTTPLEEKEDAQNEEPSAFEVIPLQYNREKAVRTFFRLSLVLVLLYFVGNYFWRFQYFGLEYVVFGLIMTWTVAVVLVRKRQNFAKATNYILFFVSLGSIYLDYIDGWTGWSITFVVPILSISALIAMSIASQVVKLRVSDYVLYLQLAAIVGIAPLLFLIMDWVRHPLPSLLSVIFSVLMFVGTLFEYRQMLIIELQKRMHI